MHGISEEPMQNNTTLKVYVFTHKKAEISLSLILLDCHKYIYINNCNHSTLATKGPYIIACIYL